MNSSGIIGVVLALLGLIFAIITCYLPKWHITSTGHGDAWGGLWEACGTNIIGLKVCQTYNDPFISTYLNVGRGMTIICILLSILALLAVFTNLIKNDFRAKVHTGAGIALLVAGLFLLIPVSWHAKNIGGTADIGACIYTGWVGGVFLMLAGGLLFCNRRNP